MFFHTRRPVMLMDNFKIDGQQVEGNKQQQHLFLWLGMHC